MGLLLTLRVFHIVLGALWVGAVVFTSFLLSPAVQAAGPAGGKVMEELQKRRMLTIMPMLAIGNLVSGIWLFVIISSGVGSSFHRSPMGMAFAGGGLMALIGFVIGLTVMRPAMMRAAAIAQGMAGLASDAERQQATDDIMRLRTRAGMSARVVATLLILATTAMAVARYL